MPHPVSLRLFAPCLVALALAAPAAAKRKPKAPDDGLPPPEAVAEQSRAVYADLAGDANPLVRRVVYFGSLELGDADRYTAIEKGLADADATIRHDALTRALTTTDKKLRPLRAAAEKTVTGYLESADKSDREQGYALLEALAPKDKDQLAVLQRTAKNGSPEARAEARARLIARGGKTAWEVIQSGLAEPEGEPEHKQAVEAMATFRDPIAYKWALERLHQMDTQGRLAREYLAQIDGKAVKTLQKDINTRYDKATEYEDRLRLAWIRAHRGDVDEVTRTLLAGLRYNADWAKLMAWEALQNSRDHATLGKLRDQMMLLLEADQASASFTWLEKWAAATGDPKVIELLQEAARGDRPEPRARGLAALTALRHRDSIALFENAMSEGRSEIRLAAARGLAAIAKPGDEQRLANFLRKEPEAEVKLALIEALANIGTPAIIDSLQFVVTDRDPRLKVAAAKAIAATGQPRAATTIALLKRDPDLDTRFFVWRHLLEIEGKKAEPEFKSGALAWLTTEHIETLGKNPKISDDLIAWIALDGNDDQRTFALDALRTRKAAAALQQVYDRSKAIDTKAAAFAALADLRAAEALPTYRAALEAEQPEIRAVALRAAGEHAHRAWLEMLLKALADRDPLARAEAARAAYRVAQRPAAE